jgi:Cu2+-exporting ATPase
LRIEGEFCKELLYYLYRNKKHAMKKLIFSSILAIAFLASCGGDADKAKTDSVQAASGNVAEVKYQCPMKCEGDKTYAATGKCPLCQMELKEVK